MLQSNPVADSALEPLGSSVYLKQRSKKFYEDNKKTYAIPTFRTEFSFTYRKPATYSRHFLY